MQNAQLEMFALCRPRTTQKSLPHNKTSVSESKIKRRHSDEFLIKTHYAKKGNQQRACIGAYLCIASASSAILKFDCTISPGLSAILLTLLTKF